MRLLRFVFALIFVSGFFAVAAPSGVFAAGATTETTTEHNATDTFTDVLPCVADPDPLYDITITYNEVDHVTITPNGSMHFTFTQTGTFEAVPTDDPSLPSFTGRFTQWGGFNGNIKNASGTFTFTIHGTGSDGSKITFHVTEHFTVNANGTVTSEFEKISC